MGPSTTDATLKAAQLNKEAEGSDVSTGQANITVVEDVDELRTKLLAYLIAVIRAAIDDAPANKIVLVGLSGGSMPSIVGPLLGRLPDVDHGRLRFFAVDERVVPVTDAESNTGAYLRHFPPELQADTLFANIGPVDDADACARNYERQLRDWAAGDDSGWPRFDVLLLGMGEDGHTCSLFAGHPLLLEVDRFVAVIRDSPKPPPCRITLTLPAVNRARHIAFVVTGETKAPVLKAIIDDASTAYPAGLVKLVSGDLCWFLDKNAASLLKSDM